ncbi:MAG: dimethylmenaquinone methyltransferase [Mameliella sp.]|nr:dimethylmenaquinone methyltransferase [Mameliella sp.]
MTEHPKTMGRIDPARITAFEIPRPDPALIAALKAVEGPTELVSDALDDLGVDGVVGSSILKPTLSGRVVVGPALTIRNEPLGIPAHEAARRMVPNRQTDFEAHNLTRPGDILVIQGGRDVSNIGGISATMAKRQGGLAAIVDGGIRDLSTSRKIDYPLWCRDVTAQTGRWRQETAEINGAVSICAHRITPGDIVVADDSGVCFIPYALLAEVVERVRRRDETDREYMDFLAGSEPLTAFPRPDPAQFRE